MSVDVKSLLRPYEHYTLSAWDRLRLALSLCHYAGLSWQALRGGVPQAYWLVVGETQIHCGRCNDYHASWHWDSEALPDDAEIISLSPVPQSQLGFLLIESAHFDHC